MITYRDALREHQQVINDQNVYPVPDGDTGTNMALTLEAVVHELGGLGETALMADVCRAVSHGSLMGARGNSGVILSQLLRGVANRFATAQEVGPEDLAEALSLASDLARRAVVRPVEGTILTVASAAASGAQSAVAAIPQDHGANGALLKVAERAQESAAEALARTPQLLDVLARAGVVDAGGSGLLLFFDALLSIVDHRAMPKPPPAVSQPGAGETFTQGDGRSPAASERATTQAPAVPELRYEVMYMLHAPDETIAAFKEVWAGIGNSIVVVGGDGLWNCHIHTNDVGPAIEAALDAGRPSEIRVTDLVDQIEEERWVREGAGASSEEPPGPPPTTDVVAVVGGEGIGRIFRSLGVHHQVRGGQTMNPSTAQLLDAVQALPCEQVILLPNNKNVVSVAEQVDSLSSKRVRVVPTGSTVEGFAALLAYDPGATVDENEAAMKASAHQVVPGEVTQAVRDAPTEAGDVQRGEWIGLSADRVVSVGKSLADVTCALLGTLIGERHELVTLIEGEGSTAADTRRITEWVHDEHAGMSVEVHHGGQPLYPYLVGIE